MSTLLRAVVPPSAEDRSLAPGQEHGLPSGAPPGRLEHCRGPFSRFRSDPQAPMAWSEESLVLDSRAELTPAQMVEKKLVSLLRGKFVPVSHMQMRNSICRR